MRREADAPRPAPAPALLLAAWHALRRGGPRPSLDLTIMHHDPWPRYLTNTRVKFLLVADDPLVRDEEMRAVSGAQRRWRWKRG